MTIPTRENGQNIDSSWFNDIKNELENGGSSMDAYALLDGRGGDVLKIDEIQEFTSDSGIKIDQLLHKDNSIIDTTADTGINIRSSDNEIQGSFNQSGLALKVGSRVNAILDQDDMSGNSDTSLATQQSIRVYTDNSISTSKNLAHNSIWIGDGSNVRKAVKNSSGDVSDIYTSVKESTVTISVATPSVITQTSHGFNTGDKVIFSTTGTLPTGISPSTLYYVSNIDANSYYVSSSIANMLSRTFVDTTVAGSGTHTSHSNGLYFTSALLRGTYTSDNAAQGFVGEYLESQTSLSNVGATGTTISGTTLGMTGGDWEAFYQIELRPNGASFSSVNVILAITGTAGNSLTGYYPTATGSEDLNQTPTTFARAYYQTPPVRVQSNGIDLIINGVTFSSTQALQGKINVGNFTGGPPQFFATLRARRVR